MAITSYKKTPPKKLQALYGSGSPAFSRDATLAQRLHQRNVQSLRASASKLLRVLLCLLTLSSWQVASACEQRDPTRSTGMGPHYVDGVTSDTTLWREGDLGEPLSIRSRVIDTCGEPIPGARVRLWHANQDGEHSHDRWRTDTTVDDQGAFSVTTVMPGYAGGIPKHIHVIVSHPGFDEIVTRLFFKNDPSIEFDDVDDLALRLEEVQRDGGTKGWVAGFEFVLKSSSGN